MRTMSQGDASRGGTWRKMAERQRSFECVEGTESREQVGNGRETRKGKGSSFTISHQPSEARSYYEYFPTLSHIYYAECGTHVDRDIH